MIFNGKEFTTMGEIFNEALNLAKTSKVDAEAFFKTYVEYIMSENKISSDEAIKIAKSNFGYFAGYYSKDVVDLIYKTYECSHPIFGDKPYEISPEEAFSMGYNRK